MCCCSWASGRAVKGRNAFSRLLGLTLRMLACSLPAAGACMVLRRRRAKPRAPPSFPGRLRGFGLGGLAFALVFLPLARASMAPWKNIRARLRRRSQG